MQPMEIIFIVLCIFTSINCFIIGGVLTYAIDYRRNREKLIQSASDYDKAFKLASESNNSIANKIIEIDGRLSDISMALNATKNAWGK